MPGIIEPQGPPDPGAPTPSLRSHLLWFAGLALASAGATAVVAYALRGLLLLG